MGLAGADAKDLRTFINDTVTSVGATAVPGGGDFTGAVRIAAGKGPWFDITAPILGGGAKLNTIGAADGTTTATSTTFTSPGAAFVTADAGKTIVLKGAGVAAATLVTTIASVQSATSLTLTVAASTSIAGTADYDYGNLDTAALLSAISHIPVTPTTGAVIFVPPGCGMFDQNLLLPGLTRIMGCGYSYIAGRANRGASCLLKIGNIDGITIGGGGSSIENLQVDGAAGNGGDGIYMLGGRSILQNVGVTSQGQDGIRVGTKTTGNTNAWRLLNVFSASNTRRGVYVHDQQSGGGTPNVNVGHVAGLTCRLNGEDGIRAEHCQDNNWHGVDSSNNTGRGFYLVNGAQGGANSMHIYDAYLEQNTAGQGLIDNGCVQNVISYARYAIALADGWVDNNTDGSNFIIGRVGTSPFNTVVRSQLGWVTDGIPGGFPIYFDTVTAAKASLISYRNQGVEKFQFGRETGDVFSLYDNVRGNFAWRCLPNAQMNIYAPIGTISTVPTVGSPGAGVSAQSVIAGGSNTAMQVQATLTAVAPGVVIGVVAFGGGALPTAPKNVVCSLSAPTAGVASPPIVGADTYTTSGFTLRVYGPTTVTTGTYIITCWVTV